MIVFNRTRGSVLGNRIAPAETFLARSRGLLGRNALGEGEGLWISPCRCIHTFGMSFPIDVLFLDREGRVLGVHPDMSPSRVTRYAWSAAGALELPAGTVRRTGTSRGDVVEFLDAEPALTTVR